MMNRRRVKKGVIKAFFYMGPTGYGPLPGFSRFSRNNHVRLPGLGRLEARVIQVTVEVGCEIRRQAFAEAVLEVLGECQEVPPVDVRIVRKDGRRILEVR
jgi:hypothetical protein